MYAVYDFQVDPVNFDVLTFLVVAKSEADKIKEPCHVIFVPGYEIDGFEKPGRKKYNNYEKIFRLSHILFPACSSMKITFTFCFCREQAEQMLCNSNMTIFPYSYNIHEPLKENRVCHLFNILDQYKEHTLFWPQQSERAKEIVQEEFPEPPVVITLRETYGEGRNSSLEEWKRFSDFIYRDNDVVFVRDTSKWNDDVRGNFGFCIPTFPVASIDLDIRLALYKHAKINFSVGGGPTVLLHYSTDVPYRTFRLACKAEPESHPDFLKKMGFPPGSQWPWHTEEQRIVWEDDSFENLKEEYDRWLDTQNILQPKRIKTIGGT